MKNYLLAFGLLIFISVSFAQTKTKPAENPPTQKEMEEMMKMMQQGMEEMSPEDKQMMDSMGIKNPDNQNVINQYNYAAENTTQQEMNSILGVETIPIKDAKRIAGLPKTVCNACKEIVSRSGECEDAPDDDDNPFQELPDFDVINCNSHIRIWTPVADAKWDCNIQKVKIELGFFNLDHKKTFLPGKL